MKQSQSSIGKLESAEKNSEGGKDVKRIQEIRLYAGKTLEAKPTEILGGIEIIYETKQGNTIKDGVS